MAIECLSINSKVNVVDSSGNKLVFNDGSSYDSSLQYGLGVGTYTLVNESFAHPIAILNYGNPSISYTGNPEQKVTQSVTGTHNDTQYDFYYGSIVIDITGDFGTVSFYCANHGYMGGENALTFSSPCAPPTSATNLVTPNIKTVRPSAHSLGAGDFTTLQAWEDYADDQSSASQWAECYSGGDIGIFNISGWSSVPTASGYARVYSPSGEYHMGVIGRGPIISPGSTEENSQVSVPYTRIEGLTTTRGINVNLDSAHHVIIKDCIGATSSGVVFKAKAELSSVSSSGNYLINCMSVGSQAEGEDYGFEVGGENMTGGMPMVTCLHCNAYAHKDSGFKIHNSNIPGLPGGADVNVINCVSVSSSGVDFSYFGAGYGNVNIGNNISSDNTSNYMSYPNGSIFGLNQRNKKATDIFINPSEKFYPSSSVGDFRPRASGSLTLHGAYTQNPAVNRGMPISTLIADSPGLHESISDFALTDLALRDRDRVIPDVGSFEFFERQVTLFSLYTTGDTALPSGSVDFFINGTPKKSSAGGVDGDPEDQYPGLNLYTAGLPAQVSTLFLRGGLPATSGLSLFTRGLVAASGMNLFISSNPNREYTLFITGKAIDDIPPELELDESSLETTSGDDGGGGVGVLPSGTKINRTNVTTLFIGQADNNIFNINTLNIRGASPFYPKEWQWLRRANVESDGYLPFGDGKTLYAKSEEHCLNTKIHYGFDHSYNHSPSGYQDLIGAETDNHKYDLTVGGLGLFASQGFIDGIKVQNRIGLTTAAFIGTSNYFIDIPDEDGGANDYSFSSRGGGIAVSFWTNKVKETKVAYSQGAGYNEGVITMGYIKGEGNDKASRSASFRGDWGIFRNPHSTTTEDLLFYTRTLDADPMKTVVTEGVPLETNRWYFVMYWINPKEKKSYIRIREGTDLTGDTLKTYVSQEWKTILASDEYLEIPVSEKFRIGLNNDGDGHMLAGSIPNELKLTGTLANAWAIDDLKISKEICSRTAMEQTFNTRFANDILEFYTQSPLSLYIEGVDSFS